MSTTSVCARTMHCLQQCVRRSVAGCLALGMLMAGWVLLTVPAAFAADAPAQTFREIARFTAPEAKQGIAVDGTYFYAINNTVVGKYEKASGKFVAKWEGSKEFPVIHFDSGVVVDGKLYLGHSNYPENPMTSSVEVLDVATMKHVSTHSIGIQLGSLTWIDRHDGAWWGVFANYSRVFGKEMEPYGNSYWTTLVKMDDNWKVQQGWIFPDEIIKRSIPMSISGGSWGPDGLLYVSGHDHPEVYAMRLPRAGSILEHVATLPLNIAGQGIAWDRSVPGVIYGIQRKTGEVIVSKID